MHAHDGIFALHTNETGFTAIVSAAMHVVLHTSLEVHPLAYCLKVEHAMKINPFTAVMRPRLPPKCLFYSALQQFLFELLKMLADHKWNYGTVAK